MSFKLATSALIAAGFIGSAGIATAASNTIYPADYDAHSPFLTIYNVYADQAGTLEIRAIDADDATRPFNFGMTHATAAINPGTNGMMRLHLSLPAKEDLVAVFKDNSGNILSYQRIQTAVK